MDIGTTINQYRIIDRIGEGGMGIVYLAEDTRLHRKVALKFVSNLSPDSTEAIARFRREAQAAARLNHPNICTIHELGETDNQIYIAFEYIDGSTLKERLRSASIAEHDIRDWLEQIGKGLQAAHKAGVVHRDIKPANIMVTGSGLIKIMDFGIAKLVESETELTQANSTIGTIAYMSPEQARGEEIDQRTDIWSVGIILYELLTGRRPFEGAFREAVMYAMMHNDPEPIATGRQGVPESLVAIVHRAIEKDPEARYSSMEELLADLSAYREGQSENQTSSSAGRTPIRNLHVLITALLVLLGIGIVAVLSINRSSKARWARQEILPEIEHRLAGERKSNDQWALFDLASNAEQYISGDPTLKRLWPHISRHVGIYSDPPGVQVYIKPYGKPEDAWRYVGLTPLDSLRLPTGVSRIMLQREGFDTVYDLAWNSGTYGDLHYQLPEAGRYPEDMVFVPEIANRYRYPTVSMGLQIPGLDHMEEQRVGTFLMDRYEVMNKDFKQFVDKGGYTNPEYWQHAFVRDGSTLSFEEAMALFVDKTGRPGPATWEVGDYADGEDDYPVAGVSWFEAAAYANFVGKQLPTIYHWDRVALTWASGEVVPLSNLDGTGTVPVGSLHALNRFGAHDLAGNVREWALNETSRKGRFIQGGGWNDPPYAFNNAFGQSAFDRSVTNGFRCMKYVDEDVDRGTLEQLIELPFRDFLNEPQVSEETYSLFLKQYAYDKTPLNDVRESVEEAEDWMREKITFDAAYGNERMMAYLFLPKGGKPPYQTVVYFPGSSTISNRSSQSLGPRADFILKSGRALIHPIYKSTYERADDLTSHYPAETTFWKDHVIMWAKDMRRSIDYLETREDIDMEKLAYYGQSWGGASAAIMAAVEPRIKTSVLFVAGLFHQRTLPEVESIHYLPRITMPVIMINGKYDFFFPYETSQVPFYELLGTPEEHKTLVAYDGGGWAHAVPGNILVKESLDWLDQYLGPVE